ncbi:MAG: serine hydrolase [Parcubacteria group bacterium]
MVLHLLASDVQLPMDWNERLSALTEQYVATPEIVLQEQPLPVDVPEVALLPVERESAARLAAKAKRAIVLDADSAKVLLAKNADEPASIASIAKLMVALVALDRMDSLDQTLKVPKSISKLEVPSTLVGFVPGDQVTVRELLKGLLVASGNDAAHTLAVGLAGDEAEFVDWMNQKAEELGLANTNFANATGLDAKGNQSTARDVAFLLLEAAKSPLLRQFSQMTQGSVTIENGGSYYVDATDDLLGHSDFDIEIAKTGTTDNAGAAFAVLAREGERRIAVVVLDSPERFPETERLVAETLASYRWPEASVGGGSAEKSDFGG